MALVSGMWGVATLCGPAIGGIFAQAGLWRWAFWSLLLVAAALALIVTTQLSGKDQSAATSSTRPPFATIGLLVLSVLAISVAGLSSSLGWNLLGIAAGLAIAAIIMRIDRRATNKLLPTGAYSLNAQLGVLYAVMSLLVAGITTEIFVPYFLQVIHRMTPLWAGYLTAAMAAGWTAASLFSAGRGGAAADRMVKLGSPIVFVALVALALMTPRPALLADSAGLAAYCVALASVGLGIGLGWPHLLTRVFTAARAGEETMASSSITTIQLYATALAAALAGIVANAAGLASPGGIVGAQKAAVWLFASFALAPALAVLLLRRLAPSTTKAV
jgi:predicted MFS family arabinose efflux permease